MSIAEMLHAAIDWIQDRLKERASWDGLTIIVLSLLALIASPLIRYAAWAGLAYGIWTLLNKDQGRFNGKS